MITDVLPMRSITETLAPRSEESVYYLKYLKGLEDFLHKESLSLTTSEYYKIAEEIESIKSHIKTL